MMFDRLRNGFSRLRALGVRAERAETSLNAITEELRSLRMLVEEMQRSQHELRERVEAVHGVAANTQLLAGETLSSVNDHRIRGLHLQDTLRLAMGRVEARQTAAEGGRTWHQNEFRVYSQFGEDGLLQFLCREIADLPHRFVEFGVEDYQEANTRFLLLQDRSWSGLVMDGSGDNVGAILRDSAYQRHDLQAVTAWISRDNIDRLLMDHCFTGEIGLLSIDVDGNDYWIWDAITAVDPVVVVIEYNYRFGPDTAVVVPYQADFDKTKAHPSAIYYGASLRALVALGCRKGYAFVGCSQGGVNAFFVRRDRLPESIAEVTVAEGYVAGAHAEMVDPATGTPVKASLEEQRNLLLTLPLVAIEEQEAIAAHAETQRQIHGTR